MLHTFNLNLPNNWEYIHLPQTDSTMLQLRKPQFACSEKEFVLITTDYQTAGRGQRGTSWEADDAKNLLFGFMFHPTQVLANHQFALSEALALSVRAALIKCVDSHSVKVKWPNDVYWQNKKICGMLLEHDLCGSHIATTLTGVGINVNQADFKSDAPNPISLKQIIGHDTDRAALLQNVLQQFEVRYRCVQQGSLAHLHQEYMQNLFCANEWHIFADVNGEFKAMIEDVSPLGMLRLKRENGESSDYAFKQVKWVK